MADRYYRSSGGGLNFISTNPATDAFQLGREIFERDHARQLQNESRVIANAEALRGAPSRLRTLEANADTARANADVAQRTVDPRVQQSVATADQATTQARVARETAPYTISTAADSAAVSRGTVQPRIDQQRAAAQTAVVQSNIAATTAPNKVRESNANAARVEMDGFLKSLDLLNKGQTDAAKQVAQAYGSTLPREIVDNAEIRYAVTDAAKYATEAYPNRPAQQQEYIRMFLEGWKRQAEERRRQGSTALNPADRYNVPGAPKPVEDNNRSYYDWKPGTGPDPNDPTKQVPGLHRLDRYGGTRTFEPGVSLDSGGSGAGTRTPGEVATAQWLVSKGVAANEAEAWNMVRTSRSNPATAYTQVFNAALKSNLGNAKKAKQIADDWQRVMQENFPQGPGGVVAPGAAPGAPQPSGRQQPPPPDLSGAGTPDLPFRATTQAHVDWFKQNAPAGAIIIVNGQKFTK